uniref:Heme oxygenase n=1 Tax=Vertebrata lanosa TaxID=1261582 RepID=A0A0B5W2Q9_9FLOR|nr:heme oxygenase [Vertebrata lanosa]AJH65949.1 heme oxygenase [Vertebrata lanosa]
MAKNAMQLPHNSGTSFYDFELIDDEVKFKDLYRKSLNNASLTKKQIDQIVLEANIAFNLNMKIFQELNSNLVKIMTMILLSSMNNFRKKFS